jgi:hypothetical protein
MLTNSSQWCVRRKEEKEDALSDCCHLFVPKLTPLSNAEDDINNFMVSDELFLEYHPNSTKEELSLHSFLNPLIENKIERKEDVCACEGGLEEEVEGEFHGVDMGMEKCQLLLAENIKKTPKQESFTQNDLLFVRKYSMRLRDYYNNRDNYSTVINHHRSAIRGVAFSPTVASLLATCGGSTDRYFIILFYYYYLLLLLFFIIIIVFYYYFFYYFFFFLFIHTSGE